MQCGNSTSWSSWQKDQFKNGVIDGYLSLDARTYQILCAAAARASVRNGDKERAAANYRKVLRSTRPTPT